MPNSTTCSSRAPICLTLNLLSRVILEIVDMGFTSKSSIIMYVNHSFHVPSTTREEPVFVALGGSTKLTSFLIEASHEGHFVLESSATYE